MQSSAPKFERHIFVCENVRAEGQGRPCCGRRGEKLRELLKDAVKKAGLADRVRVSRTGCLDVCEEGPNVLLEPDNVWLRRVEEKDVPEIVRMASEGLK